MVKLLVALSLLVCEANAFQNLGARVGELEAQAEVMKGLVQCLSDPPPTAAPTAVPSIKPTAAPTAEPSSKPTAAPPVEPSTLRSSNGLP